MKLYFQTSDVPLFPERYRYAVEQMMLTLFPGERPEYPEEIPHSMSGEDNAVLFDFRRRERLIRISVQVFRPQGCQTGVSNFPSSVLDRPPEEVYHFVQSRLKLAFYKAGTAILGHELPWGTLTGVRPVKVPTRMLLLDGLTPTQAERHMQWDYHVSPERARLAVACAQATVEVQRALIPDLISLYVGIPFCPTRCAYCSFVSADVSRTLKLVEPYLDALLREVEETGRVLKGTGLKVCSFYIGGGTPTTLSADQLDRLLSKCEESLPLELCAEYTVEAGRPDTITREKLEVLARHGTGRVSINPQTLEDHVLEAIGRKHSTEDIRAAYSLARSVGFDCINMDLIAGLPRDSFDGFRHSLEGILAMDPENITVHTLALKKGARLMEEGGASFGTSSGALPGGGEVTKMLDWSRDVLKTYGYSPYYLYRQKYMSGSLENVGWTKPNRASLYNIVMMEELHTVVSLGAGGVTKLIGDGTIRRLTNPKYPHDYLSGLDKVLAQKAEIPAFYQSI